MSVRTRGELWVWVDWRWLKCVFLPEIQLLLTTSQREKYPHVRIIPGWKYLYSPGIFLESASRDCEQDSWEEEKSVDHVNCGTDSGKLTQCQTRQALLNRFRPRNNIIITRSGSVFANNVPVHSGEYNFLKPKFPNVLPLHLLFISDGKLSKNPRSRKNSLK